jgi:hypothetical protein
MPYGSRLTKQELLDEADRYERLERESRSQVTSSLSPEYYAQMARKFRERLAAVDEP